jgi:NADPH:quinone reductase-like Zn-dependent oxidoreductase
MRALALLRQGDRPSVQEIAVPSVDDAALIRVTFAGVNPIDYILVDQLSAASKFPLNISSKTNPLASTDGLTKLGEMLANGRISARIHRRAELNDASSILQQLHKGALSGKTVIHIGQETETRMSA